MTLIQFVQNLHQEESGQDLVEYALVLVAVAFAVVAGSASITTTLQTAMTGISARITTAINSVGP
jgi:Flp pilus assembly pilin Flp